MNEVNPKGRKGGGVFWFAITYRNIEIVWKHTQLGLGPFLLGEHDANIENLQKPA